MEKKTQSIADWQLRPNRNGDLRAVYRNGESLTPERAWKDLALKINRRALRGSHAPVEIFLYLRDGLHDSIYNYGILEETVAAARDHAWGGRLYVVWESVPATMFEPTFGEGSDQILLARSFCAFLREGVTDLLEITRRDKPGEGVTFEDEKRILRGCAVASERRRDALRAAVSEDGWGYVLRSEAWLLEDLLKELLTEGCLPASGSNHVAIFDAVPRFGPKELLDKFRRVNRTNAGIVAATPEGYSRDLDYQCTIGAPPLELVTFNGIFEIVYALLQLNKARRHDGAAGGFAGNVPVDIEAVELSASRFFPASGSRPSSRLLITSAFHPGEERDQSIAAAREVGEMLRALPFHLDIEVHPCITCESLPDLLESGEFAAWIHLSHGEDSKGLYEPQSEEYASPERWLACFTSYRNSLRLALFSSCESAVVARLFAESGVGVAIGFKKEVLVEATRLLVSTVVRAAMQLGGDEESILAAFRDACERLAARTIALDGRDVSYIAAQPVAFHPGTKIT